MMGATGRTQAASLLSMPTVVQDEITQYLLKDGHAIQDVTRLRSTHPVLKNRADAFMRRPDQMELALRMTRNSMTNLAWSVRLSDQEFQAQVTKLIGRHTHVDFNLREIDSARRLQIVLDCLANATHLRTVELNASHMPDRFAAVLDATTRMSARNTQLNRFVINASANRIGAEEARTLADYPAIVRLIARNNQIDHAGAQALAASETLRELDLGSNRIGVAGAQALAENTVITKLDIGSNQIGAAGARALAENTTITRLNVKTNSIGIAGALALAANTTITELDVSFNLIREPGMQAFAENTTLRQLEASGNSANDAGAQALAQNSTIHHLTIRFNGIADAGALALAANTTLRVLDLRYNTGIGFTGQQALRQSTTLAHLDI